MEVILVVALIAVVAIVRYKTIRSGKIFEEMADEMYKDDQEEKSEE